MLCAVALAVALGCSGRGAPLLVLQGDTMGTGWSVRLRAAPDLPPRAALAQEIQAILDRVDARMSTWREDSEISRFNAARASGWLPVSDETASVVQAALRTSRRTAGAFDPTVGPLVDAWGFGPSARGAPEARAPARARVGYAALAVREDPPALRKSRPDLALDLSAIAKGHAVDAVAAFLAARGARDFVVEVGGELRASGLHPGGRPWRVAVERPDTLPPAAVGVGGVEPLAWAVLELRDAAIATSGDYRRFFDDAQGVRRSHLIDPRDGLPAHHGLASASVVARSATEADALATALMVLGPRDGLRLAREEGWAVLLIERRDGGLVEHTSPAFDRLARIDAAPSARRPARGGSAP